MGTKDKTVKYEEIEPCPFCGNTNMRIETVFQHIEATNRVFGEMFQVMCPGCAALGSLQKDAHKAIVFWNTVSIRWFASEHERH